jgi:hypothetical protein
MRALRYAVTHLRTVVDGGAGEAYFGCTLEL